MKCTGFFLLYCAFVISCKSTNSSDQNGVSWWTTDDQQLIISELNKTTNELKEEIENISIDQWSFREDSTRWSIAEIVEHLEMQNQLHYREISVTSKAPQYLKYRQITEGKDAFFSNYSVDPTKSKAKWFLEPSGKFCSKKECEEAFYKVRTELTKYIDQTDVDLRKQFTFRTPVEGKEISNIKIGQVRDLHQLLLTGIAHTYRHLDQLRKIKQHPDYPIN